MSREQIVRDTAYAIWEAEGKPDGRDSEHWRQAEARVSGSLTSVEQPITAKPTSVKPGTPKSSTVKSAKTAATDAKAPAKGRVAAAGERTTEAKPPAKTAATKAAPTKPASPKAR